MTMSHVVLAYTAERLAGYALFPSGTLLHVQFDASEVVVSASLDHLDLGRSAKEGDAAWWPASHGMDEHKEVCH